MEPPWEELGTNLYNGQGHMIKTAAMPIYNSIISGTNGLISTKLGMKHWGLWPIIVCSNDDLGLTVTYFMARLNLVVCAFEWGITV